MGLSVLGYAAWRLRGVVRRKSIKLTAANQFLQVENAERRRAEALLRLQLDLTVSMNAKRSLRESLDALLEILMRIPSVDSGGVYLARASGSGFDLYTHRGLSPAFVKECASIEPGSIREQVVLEGRVIQLDFLNIIQNDINFNMIKEGLRAVVVVPVKFEGKVIAVLNVASHTEFTFSSNTLTAIEAAAMQIGGIIERQQAEETERRSRANLETLFSNIEDFIVIADEGGRIMKVSPSVCRHLGYTETELACMKISALHPPADEAQAGAIWARMLLDELDFCALPLRRKDGSLIPVETRVVRGRWDEKVAFFGVSRDISERQRAEASLRESVQNFRNLAESAFDAIVIVDADAKICYANRRMAEMMGYSVEESIGMSFASVIHPTELERIINRFQNRMKGLVEPNRYESVFIRHDGEKMPVEISARLIEWQGQRATMAYCTDLTERKRLEDEVLKISQWEKQRIGHDLHDALGQQLTGIAYLSKDLESDLTDESSAHVAKAARLGFLLRTAIELVRRVVRGLTPVEMDEGGLPAGLSRLANEAQTTMGIECRFDNGVKTPIRNLEAASHLYHIAQEALTNAVRHGGARNVTIRLFEDGSQGELVVEDDGTGLLPCDGQQDGSGLKIMRYRVNRVGGKLSLTSNGKAGLAVHCTFDMGLAGLIDTLGDRNGSA